MLLYLRRELQNLIYVFGGLWDVYMKVWKIQIILWTPIPSFACVFSSEVLETENSFITSFKNIQPYFLSSWGGWSTGVMLISSSFCSSFFKKLTVAKILSTLLNSRQLRTLLHAQETKWKIPNILNFCTAPVNDSL